MGREPVGTRQHFLFHLAVGVTGFFLIGGCAHDQAPISPIEIRFEQVEACRRLQDFACAAQLLAPIPDRADAPADPRRLYLAGMVAADKRNPARSLPAARNYFQRVAEEHPESPLAVDATVWIGLLDERNAQVEACGMLQSDNDRLQQEIEARKADLRRMEKRLERLKAVDLSLE